jgi:fructose-bisphosphate aldolase class I
MNTKALASTIDALLASSKGILAADESFGTIDKRFKALSIESNESSRRAYRQTLFTTPGLSEHISGVILFDETIRQKTDAGKSFASVLSDAGIVLGIKVDGGTVDLPGFAGEKFTQGLDGLKTRLDEYRQLGARFTKWRAVIKIGPQIPSQTLIETNARIHALFASLSQAADLVPIVEPEVLMDGDHSIECCEEVSRATLAAVFKTLTDHRVPLELMLLKTNMVLSGKEAKTQADDAAVSAATLRVLRETVPPAVPGIVFLSGGQSDIEATRRLNVIAQTKNSPWKITFSYGRALQDAAMKIWYGQSDKIAEAQKALALRAKANGLAVLGQYSSAIETSR